MDKHICKAKDINTGEWVYGYYVCVPHKYGHEMAYLIIEEDCDYDDWGEFWYMDVHDVDPDTVCRCTGMKDKNGVLIYENDCIGHMLNVVEYVNDGFYINGDRSLSWFAKYFEVIGNKFDNTELMEK